MNEDRLHRSCESEKKSIVARTEIMARLQRGDLLVLDGATGSELQRNGVNPARGLIAPSAHI